MEYSRQLLGTRKEVWKKNRFHVTETSIIANSEEEGFGVCAPIMVFVLPLRANQKFKTRIGCNYREYQFRAGLERRMENISNNYALRLCREGIMKSFCLPDDAEQVDIGVVYSEVNEHSSRSTIQPQVFLQIVFNIQSSFLTSQM